jgi:hypothetical protein
MPIGEPALRPGYGPPDWTQSKGTPTHVATFCLTRRFVAVVTAAFTLSACTASAATRIR